MSGVVSLTFEDGLAWISIENPPVNALSSVAFAELEAALSAVERSREARVVLIAAKGPRAFVAGIDLREVLGFGTDAMMEFNRVSRQALQHVEALPQPVVAVVGAAALGAGCELALACDFRIAGERASFALPEVGLGIIPGGGGTQRLTRLVGEARSKDLIMRGRVLSARQALDLGLVNEVAADAELIARATGFAKELCLRPGLALAEAKRLIHAAPQLPLAEGLAEETRAFMRAFASSDGQEGMRAAMERRPPRFAEQSV